MPCIWRIKDPLTHAEVNPSHVTSYRANSPTKIGTSTHLVTLRRHRGRDPIFDLGCRWWTTLLSLEYVLAECTAPAMACFLDTRSESNCKEHLTDRYRAMTSYQLMGSLMDHHTGNSIGHLHSTASCGPNRHAVDGVAYVSIQRSRVFSSFRMSSDLHEVSVLMDASRIKGAHNSMTNATLVLNQQGSSRPWDSQS